MNKITFKQLAPFLALSVVAIAAIFVKPAIMLMPKANTMQPILHRWYLLQHWCFNDAGACFYGGMVHRRTLFQR